MKLPGIMYRAPSKLASPSAGEVLQTGYATADAIMAGSRAAGTWAVAEDTEQTHKNINEQKTLLNTVEGEIKNSSHWDVADLDAKNISYPQDKIEEQPMYDPMGEQIGTRKVIPTEYVASDLYKRAAGEAATVAQTTGVFRDNNQMAKTQIGNAINTGSSSVSTWSFNKRYERLNTSAVQNYERAIESGDLIGALGVIEEGAKGGWLDQGQIAKMTSEAPSRAAVAISDAAINATNSPDVLEDLALDIENGVGLYGPMTEVKKRTQARAARSKAQDEHTGQDREYRLSQQRFDSEIMLKLYQGDVSIDEAMKQSTFHGTPTGQARIVGFANTQNEYGPAVSDQGALGAMQARIALLELGPNVGQRADDMVIELYTEMAKGPESQFSPKHVRAMVAEIDKKKFSYSSRPDYKETKEAISIQITQVPESQFFAFGDKISPLELRINNAAQADLAQYMQSRGRRANPREWWDLNQLNYEPDTWTLNQYKDKGLNPVIVDGKVDYEQTKQKYLDEGAASKLLTIEKLYNQTRNSAIR